MTADELRAQNELADQLIAKLERIKDLWSELPNDADVTEYSNEVGGIAVGLEQAREAYLHEDFPNLETLQELAKEAGDLADSLTEAKAE